jgi:HlyD family secretion protein
MKKKLIISGSIIVVLAIGIYLIFFRSAEKKYEFRFDKVSKGDLTVFVTATGTINPVTSVDVGTQVSGIISKLYADFNSVVTRGQVVAQIDPTFLVQSVKDAEAGVEKAKAQLADSKRARDRQTTLLEKHLDSQVNFDAAMTAYETNAATLKSAQASLDRAKINLAYATIYAPISGVVINRAVNVGQTVAASFSSPTLYTIANDLSKMQVLATVDESDIGRISIGQEASFTVDAYEGETFRGAVSQIRLASVAIQNVVNYTVVIGVNNDKLKLMPGMTASVKILVANVNNVLRVPNMALRFQPPADITDTVKVNALKVAMTQKKSGDASGGGGSDNRDRTDDAGRNTKAEARTSQAPAAPIQRAANARPQFGIELRFPEYQKSEYKPSSASGRGKVWILNAQGKLEPVAVRTGITDGKFTEITSAKLKPGDQIVLGATSNSDGANTAVKNPLTPSGQQQQRPGGGGMR